MRNKQLWIDGSGGRDRRRAVLWPDGSVCWEINLYLSWLRRRSAAASSIRTYASDLSSSVRYLYCAGVDFVEIDDRVLIEFSRSLLSCPRGFRAPSNNHINRIVLRMIGFLSWFQAFMGLDGQLVGPPFSGARITVEVRLGRNRGTSSLVHQSRLPASSPQIVRPIGRDTLKLIREAVPNVVAGGYFRARTFALLTLLADTGCRREEATFVRLEDIAAAERDERQLLPVRTSKRKGAPQRFVPVARTTLIALKSYVEVDRALFARRLVRKGRFAADWLFLTQEGERLNPETITQLFAALRRNAGISGPATAHMLRHRWITLQVVERLVACQSPILSRELGVTILTKVASITGHASIESLWAYVDFAFEEVSGKTAEPLIALWRELDAFDTALQTFKVQATHRDPEAESVLVGSVDAVLAHLVSIKASKHSMPKEQLDAHSFRRSLDGM